MTRDEAKQIFTVQDITYEEVIDAIYDAHEAKLKAKDKHIAELEANLENMCAECEGRYIAH